MSDQPKVKRPVGRPPTGAPESKTMRVPIALEEQVRQLAEQYRAKHAADRP